MNRPKTSVRSSVLKAEREAESEAGQWRWWFVKKKKKKKSGGGGGGGPGTKSEDKTFTNRPGKNKPI